jgi:chondroitin 4-sulfotransferase 11
LIYSEKSNVLFTHISRTGGMTIDNYMRRTMSDARTIVGQHAPLVAARSLLGRRFDESYKFAFVRNPWERFVSWYSLLARAKAANDLRCGAGEPESMHTESLDPSARYWQGFDAFLENWCKQEVPIDGVQRHQFSQWAQLVDANGCMLVNDIGRFENYAADAARLFANTNIDVGLLPKTNASRHHHYSVYYSAFGRELIEHAFPEDIMQLGYQFELCQADPCDCAALSSCR